MKFLISIIALFLLTINTSMAQLKYDYHWLFGYDFNGTFPGVEGVDINFNNSPASTDLYEIPLEIYFSNSTMSDKNGDLIFYTNGCQIANKNHEIMMNGDSINPGEVHDFICPTNGYIGAQSSLIFPSLNNQNQYFLFYKGAIFESGFPVYTNKLYYSLIDMSLDDGLGGVMEKNITVLEDTLRAGEMTAIKHINGEDWWLINAKYNSNQYVKFLVSSDAITGPFLQEIGLDANSTLGDGSGQVVFSPDGTKYARYNEIDQVYLYDFDRSTGEFSNFEHIIVNDTIGSGGCAISSNSRFLYVSTSNRLYQFDLEATDIESSKVLIDVYDGSSTATFKQMQLAPDCRIFMNSTINADELHIIHSPNEKGLACNFEQGALKLPSKYRRSMPHFPYYRMDTDFPICDSSLVVSSTQVYQAPKEALRIFPNPATHRVTVDWGKPLIEQNELKIYNMIGQVMKTQIIEEGITQVEVSIADLPNGIYLLKIGQEKTVTLKVIN